MLILFARIASDTDFAEGASRFNHDYHDIDAESHQSEAKSNRFEAKPIQIEAKSSQTKARVNSYRGYVMRNKDEA